MSSDRHRACISRAAAAVLAVAFVFFALGWIGGGDAKLAAATALWLGFDHLLDLSGLRLAVRRRADAAADPVPRRCRCRRCWRGQQWVQRLHEKDGGVPYGIALAAAALVVYPHTAWMAYLGALIECARAAPTRGNPILTRFGYASLTMP